MDDDNRRRVKRIDTFLETFDKRKMDYLHKLVEAIKK